jgi:hypothetical protein
MSPASPCFLQSTTTRNISCIYMWIWFCSGTEGCPSAVCILVVYIYICMYVCTTYIYHRNDECASIRLSWWLISHRRRGTWDCSKVGPSTMPRDLNLSRLSYVAVETQNYL